MKLGKEAFQFWGKFLISTGTSLRIVDSQDWLELKMN